MTTNPRTHPCPTCQAKPHTPCRNRHTLKPLPGNSIHPKRGAAAVTVWGDARVLAGLGGDEEGGAS